MIGVERLRWAAVGMLLVGGGAMLAAAEQLPIAVTAATGWWWWLIALLVRARPELRISSACSVAMIAAVGDQWLPAAVLLWAAAARDWRRVGVAAVLLPAQLRPELQPLSALVLWLVLLAAVGGLRVLRGRLPRRMGAELPLVLSMAALRGGAIAADWWPLSGLLLIAAVISLLQAAALSRRVRSAAARTRLHSAALWAMTVLTALLGSEAGVTAALLLQAAALLRPHDPAWQLGRLALLRWLPLVWVGAAVLLPAAAGALLPLWLTAWWWLLRGLPRAVPTGMRRGDLPLLATVGPTLLLPLLWPRLAAAAARLSVLATPFGTAVAAPDGGLLVLSAAAQPVAGLPLAALLISIVLLRALLEVLPFGGDAGA
jgi:hypothetical protein